MTTLLIIRCNLFQVSLPFNSVSRFQCLTVFVCPFFRIASLFVFLLISLCDCVFFPNTAYFTRESQVTVLRISSSLHPLSHIVINKLCIQIFSWSSMPLYTAIQFTKHVTVQGTLSSRLRVFLEAGLHLCKCCLVLPKLCNCMCMTRISSFYNMWFLPLCFFVICMFSLYVCLSLLLSVELCLCFFLFSSPLLPSPEFVFESVKGQFTKFAKWLGKGPVRQIFLQQNINLDAPTN